MGGSRIASSCRIRRAAKSFVGSVSWGFLRILSENPRIRTLPPGMDTHCTGIGATEAAILLSNVSRWIHGCCGRSIRDVAERGAESAVLECRYCSFLRRFAGFSADSGVSGPLAAASRRLFDWTGLVERI